MAVDVALPSFILGYHGCDAKIAEQIFAGQTVLQRSQNDYDWLGGGIYFWEHNAQRAYKFAQAMATRPHPSGQSVQEPAVVGAIIDLGHCVNLLDNQYIDLVRQAYDSLARVAQRTGSELPRNSGGDDLVDRKLDCAVIRSLHEGRRQTGKPPFDTVRAAFFEGGRLYDNAGFAAGNHIQICVCNPRRIIGYFRPLDEQGRPAAFG